MSTSAPADPAQPAPTTVKRAISASAIGNMTEWFDYGVYAYATTYITAQFFPEAGTAATLLVFAVSFVFRPLGGLVLGPLGDRLGRKAVLASTIMLMAGATFAIGLLPGHATIGIWAPVLLVLLRVVQGFSAGGEYGGAATFMAEYAPSRRRGFLGSFLEFGTLAGFTAGALIVLGTELVVGSTAMADWGWRIPFLVAGPLGAVGLYLRTKLEDTPIFNELQEEQGAHDGKLGLGHELRELFTTYRRPLFALGGLVVALNVCNYTLLAYMPTYLENKIGLSSTASLTVVIIGQLVMMLVIPVSGRLSDRLGRKPLWWTSLAGLFVLAIPMYLLMAQSFVLAIVAFAVLGLLYVFQLSTISATFPAMFPTQVRFAGFAIAYNVSTALFGGTAPYLNEALIEATGNSLVPAFSMMAACAVGGIALLFVPETARASIRGTGIPGVDTEVQPVEEPATA
ncbi:MFS transporter [Nocardioides iriomotensis]|uniref:Putative proline/betaine transporter n=1 Tax=Nocardioides iriomotensis TaxID=715784 RepID=A0A4Q5IWY0_9ACTN|nr:MFS transporter [Nocardioides iriomotensis]RYU09369.1 MFS transporter [Nocardioides iriomotensis]